MGSRLTKLVTFTASVSLLALSGTMVLAPSFVLEHVARVDARRLGAYGEALLASSTRALGFTNLVVGLQLIGQGPSKSTFGTALTLNGFAALEEFRKLRELERLGGVSPSQLGGLRLYGMALGAFACVSAYGFYQGSSASASSSSSHRKTN